MSDPVDRRVHDMPFGAAVGADGVRFRLWAPDAGKVQLLVDGAEERLEPAADGWWERTLPAAPGARYRFRIDGGLVVPDPASRHQPEDVHGPSEVVDPASFRWTDGGWRGRPWEETVLYELHPGTFSSQGGFDGVRRRLEGLADLDITAVELMPVADFPGRRNWGYDGVLPFAPDASYGRPEDLKALVSAAHGLGLMVFLDVVYNHFGPEGNYLHAYAKPFFNPEHPTPWGDAINLDGQGSDVVRDFFIHNALYWLEEYHLDGLRLDAVHALRDRSRPSFLEELARRVRRGPGAGRHVHLVLENDANDTSLLARDAGGAPTHYVAQWNDDAHHALHCLATGESGGYYAEYADDPVRHLGRTLAEGFAWQGEPSPYRGADRGRPSSHLPPLAFVNFLQNHDQIGNRAFGDRITALAGEEELRALTAVLLLSPSPPLLFMGQEIGSRRPFPFFCDFGAGLARSVTDGRRREFESFPEFRDAAARARIPDPNAVETFRSAALDGAEAVDAGEKRWRAFHRELLRLRREEIVPRLPGCPGDAGRYRIPAPRSLEVDWRLGDGSRLMLRARLGPGPRVETARPPGRLLWSTGADAGGDSLRLGPWSVSWFLDEGA